MPPNRRPTEGSVRRSHVTGINQRGELTNKRGRHVMYENQASSVLAVQFDRRRDVRDFISFPRRLPYFSIDSVWLDHIPAFEVILVSGGIEYHDIYPDRINQTDAVVWKIKELGKTVGSEGASYVVHTQDSLPGPTEATNLLFLFGYRARAYRDAAIEKALIKLVAQQGESAELKSIVEQNATQLSIQVSDVACCAFHLIWNQLLQVDMNQLICSDSSILPRVFVSACQPNTKGKLNE